MTREELKTHCLKQIEGCEMWARYKGEEPHGKVYEEHKLILELLEEQDSVLDKIRADILEMTSHRGFLSCETDAIHKDINAVFDKYKAESENKE